MNHLTDEELMLRYYGEPGVEADAASHLKECESCAIRFAELQRVLNSLKAARVPERSENYEAEVWRRIEPLLNVVPMTRKPVVRQWRTWGAIAAMLVVGVAGYLVGRAHPKPNPAPEAGSVKERILLVALTDHLERSSMVLAEIENAGDGKAGTLDLSFERSQAEELLDANRLYRLTAVSNGDQAAASLLDDLERALLEIAHSPDQVTRSEMETLRSRIEDRGLKFKVKVFSTGLVDQEKGRL